MGDLTLIHALCSALPPPGYNKDRPHAFALTLSSGSSYFFQAGTADLVNEWVSTCNYWAARLSREPLKGGVSNMEYGWRQAEAVNGGDDDENGMSPTMGDDDREDVASMRSGRSLARSHRSSVVAGGTRSGTSSGDRLFIHDWQPPQPPTVPSTLGEEAQLSALRRHARYLRIQHKRHNELRSPMTLLVSICSIQADKFDQWNITT